MKVTAVVPLAPTILVVVLVLGRPATGTEARLRVLLPDRVSIEIPVVNIILWMLIVTAVPVIWLVAAVVVGGTLFIWPAEITTHAIGPPLLEVILMEVLLVWLRVILLIVFVVRVLAAEVRLWSLSLEVSVIAHVSLVSLVSRVSRVSRVSWVSWVSLVTLVTLVSGLEVTRLITAITLAVVF